MTHGISQQNRLTLSMTWYSAWY